MRWRPAWVHVSDPMAAPFGLLGCIARMRVLYHEHDAPVDARPSRFVRMLLRARSALLRRATILVTPNGARSEAMSAEAGGRSVITVWNCPLVSEVARRARTPASGALKLVYHGSIVPGRPPITILDAMERATGLVELTVAGYETHGARGYVQELIARARELGIGDRLTVLPAMPRHALLEIAARSDLGLSFMPEGDCNWNELRMAGASNKAFEYLASGVPLLVSDLPDWVHIFVREGVAWACDASKVDSLVRILDGALGDRTAVAAMGERGRQLVLERWNYETQFAPVLRAMNSHGQGATDDATR
jgi:glycosyltransferase involved in cell wall biosynthesis